MKAMKRPSFLEGVEPSSSAPPRPWSPGARRWPVRDALLGRVVDARMAPLDGGPPPSLKERVRLAAAPPPAMARRRILRPLVLGIRALDGCLTLGEGQRIGVMAGPSVGKSALLGPHVTDQFYWAHRLSRLGVAGPRIRARQRDVDELVGAVQRAVSDAELQSSCGPSSQLPRFAGLQGCGGPTGFVVKGAVDVDPRRAGSPGGAQRQRAGRRM